MKNKVSLKSFVTERTALKKNTKKEEINTVTTSNIEPIENNINFNQFNKAFSNIEIASFDLVNAFSFNTSPILSYNDDEQQLQIITNVCNDYMEIINQLENGSMPLLESSSINSMASMFKTMYINRVIDLFNNIDKSINAIICAAVNNLQQLGISNKYVNDFNYYTINFGYFKRLARSISVSDNLYNRMYRNDNVPDMRYLANMLFMAGLHNSDKIALQSLTIGICSSIYNDLALRLTIPVEGEFYINYINSIITKVHFIVFDMLTRLAYEAYLLVDYLNK